MKKKTISQQTFLKRFKDTIKQYDMLHKGDRVLVAVSGGADSVCLLVSLLAIRRQLDLDVVVANIDHCLRGKESVRDSNFVIALAKDLGVECAHKKVNVKAGGRKGASVEEKAREERYKFLVKTARDKKCGVIATGHTLDDQAETVLMKVIYGSALAGMSGIPPVRFEDEIKIVRPLIRTEKTDMLAFLKKEKVKHVEDSSNKDTDFLRNKIRLEAIPFLEKYNPKLKRSLANLSDTLREDLEVVISGREKALSKVVKANARSAKIKDLILQPATIRKEIFKELFVSSGGNVKKLTYRHWMDMDVFLRMAEKGKALDLPGGVQVVKRKDTIAFSKHKA